MSRFLIVVVIISLAGCFSAPDYASIEDIAEAAKFCGLTNFEPTPSGGDYAIIVSSEVPSARQKEQCIKETLASQGLFVANPN